MLFTDNFFLHIKKIHLVHEYVLDSVNRCEYPISRGHYGLCYVLSGQAEWRFFSGERFTVTDGNIIFLSPNTAYHIVAEKEFRHYTVNFDIYANDSRLDILNQPYYLLENEGSYPIMHSFTKLTDIWSSKKDCFEMRSLGQLYELLSVFYLACSNRQSDTSYKRLLPAKEYIEQNFDREITLEKLAALSYMSVTNFRREWKKKYPEAPMQYRDSIRIYYAKEYLKSGYYNVSQVAQKCGFDDISYFIRFFKKQTGITPGEYKNQQTGL